MHKTGPSGGAPIFEWMGLSSLSDTGLIEAGVIACPSAAVAIQVRGRFLRASSAVIVVGVVNSNQILRHVFSCKQSFRRGSLPGLHQEVARPHRNSTSRRENFVHGTEYDLRPMNRKAPRRT